MRGDMFFGTQDGKIMQADRTGYDNGLPYVAVWSAAGRCFSRRRRPWCGGRRVPTFTARNGEPFQPQLSATTDYVVTLPTPPPPVGPDPGVLDLWDQGLWDHAKWDQASVGRQRAPIRATPAGCRSA
jgi:hypothetical protein